MQVESYMKYVFAMGAIALAVPFMFHVSISEDRGEACVHACMATAAGTGAVSRMLAHVRRAPAPLVSKQLGWQKAMQNCACR